MATKMDLTCPMQALDFVSLAWVIPVLCTFLTMLYSLLPTLMKRKKKYAELLMISAKSFSSRTRWARFIGVKR